MYNCWITMVFVNNAKETTIKLYEIEQDWGKFWEGDRDNEVDPHTFVRHEIAPGESWTMSACGRSASPSGTQGHFIWRIKDTDTDVCTVCWDVPFRGPNVFGTKGQNPNWSIYEKFDLPTSECLGGHGEHPIGKVTIYMS